ncbi:hypothetical protein F5876DRAFT_37749 [Lentinula aff. lateritia]|uniref:Uncharacterized protein n=1 Tax=Lentinula aff. lateritia TaxID=2804960 RepID=A0ACC1U5D1_9AGAR|nr:hypothetical protein F5876DRAFT_37749 [Lentinula aff. lateritia]
MRNTGSSKMDISFRLALDNMRYKSCTKEDLLFLNTLVSSKLPGRPFVGKSPWRDAAIIVGENKYKDEINRLGCLRFAADTKQKLTNFYSDDLVSGNADQGAPAKSKNKKQSMSSISKDLQQHLWELPTCAHEYHAPPVLSLCIGLPIIIRYNIATELSITKGQRGTVYAWHESTGAFGQCTLDVLFVLLDDPPTPIQVPDLPPNVVPLTRRKTKGIVTLKNDVKISVTRFQVDVLPGFSMTAYASQGQGLIPNATDLNTLSDHHAMYTALSRSRSAASTVILQGFDSRAITGGASGPLRKEYCELEILDEITHLKYEGTLDPSVVGVTRNLLIESFLVWKGTSYVPSQIHSAVSWSAKDPYIQQSEQPLSWSRVQKKAVKRLMKQNKKSNTSENTTTSPAPLVPPDISKFEVKSKKRNLSDVQLAILPTGLTWSNNSCAFDSVLLILLYIWMELNITGDEYSNLPQLIKGFSEYKQGKHILETVRDDLRISLNSRRPREFNLTGFCSSTAILEEMLKMKSPFMTTKLQCEQGHLSRRRPHNVKVSLLEEPRLVLPSSTNEWISVNGPASSSIMCNVCNLPLRKLFHIKCAPNILAFACDGRPQLKIDYSVHLQCNNEDVHYVLKGVIYYIPIREHFISRIVASDNMVYIYDGMFNNGVPILESSDYSVLDWAQCQSGSASAVIYSRTDN